MKMNLLDWVALVLVLVGGLNWGLVGAFDWNLVDMLFGPMSVIARAVYVLVGLGALYMVWTTFMNMNKSM